MKGCLLCLQNHKKNVGYIQVNSTHWLEFNIQNIIEKHLWPIKSIHSSSFLCTLCWGELYGFHKFFMAIKAAQAKSFEMETHGFQMSKESIGSLNDEVKLENTTDRYETEILMEQTLPTGTHPTYTSTIIMENTIPNIKLEEEIFVYNSSWRANSSQENSHTELYYDGSDETNSVVTEINESEICFNLNRNLELPAKDLMDDYMENTKSSEEQKPTLLIPCESHSSNNELESRFLDENNGSHLPSTNYSLQLTNEHTLKPPAKRGRPRKNFINTLRREEVAVNSSETENHNSFISIQQEDEYGEDISLKKKKRGRPKNSQISEQKKKMWACRMISRPARKRKLPRKYLTYDVDSTKEKTIRKELYLYFKSGKRGRPRKILINSINGSNISSEQILPTDLGVNSPEQLHQTLCYDNMPKKTGKRGRPRKYFTKDIVTSQELCSDMPSTSTGKRGRPRKNFTNDIQNTDIPNEQTVTLENSTPFINSNHPRVKSKLKIRRRCRPYKDLMRNYIATSVRCMQLFKSKNNGGHSESENGC